MTVYNGAAIAYDAIGNPTNDGEWNYAWEKGGQTRYYHYEKPSFAPYASNVGHSSIAPGVIPIYL